MNCPQCGAEVPTDDSFCGKCGYAMREVAPERVDQSRIRLHEQPREPEAPNRGSSQQRIRKHTVMGMPTATPPAGSPRATPPPPPPPPPPTELSAARDRTRKRAPQKTMLGIPPPDLDEVLVAEGSEVEEPEAVVEEVPIERFAPPSESTSSSHRARARVRYDSANESYPMMERRKKALRILALLVLAAGAWLAYRYFSLNG